MPYSLGNVKMSLTYYVHRHVKRTNIFPKRSGFCRTLTVIWIMVVIVIIALFSISSLNESCTLTRRREPWQDNDKFLKNRPACRGAILQGLGFLPDAPNGFGLQSNAMGEKLCNSNQDGAILVDSASGTERIPSKSTQGKEDDNTILRYYINPVKALLQQAGWNYAFLNEIDGHGSLEKHQLHIVARIPKISEPRQEEPPNEDILGNYTQIAGVNCPKIFENDLDAFINAEFYQKKVNFKLPPDALVYNETRNCEKFKRTRQYVKDAINTEEENFPLAFSLLVYKDIAQLERLLRAIYRPQNVYCIHVDRKSPSSVHDAATSLAGCFNNVKMASRAVQVDWGRYGVLEAELVCLQDLWQVSEGQNRKWKYFINLTGQEFPLKTNWELVRILKTYNGAVDIGATISSEWSMRTKCFYYWFYANRTCLREKETPKYNLTLAKGPVHLALTHAAAEFVLFSDISRYLLVWLNGTIIPDETFFPTLFSSPQLDIPGAYKGRRVTHKRAFHPMVRFKKWTWWRPCRGKTVRHICLATLWDLPELKVRPEMFVNKFDARHHWLAYTCLEKLHMKKVQEEIAASKHGMEMTFDTSAYRELPWINNHV